MKTQPTEEMWKTVLKKWKAKSEGKKSDNKCVFCDAYLSSRGGCPDCPLTMGLWDDQLDGEGACWNEVHPWFAWHIHPTRQTALAVYKFILSRYKEWQAKDA